MKKTVSALALAGSLALFGAGAAQAAENAPYPAPAPGAGTSQGTVAPGETFNYIGGGFAPNSPVTITITRLADEAPAAAGAGAGRVGAGVNGLIVLSQNMGGGTVMADDEGNFVYPVTLEEEGFYELLATGVDPDGDEHVLVAYVTVDAAAAPAAPANPGTGTGAGTGAGVGTGVSVGGTNGVGVGTEAASNGSTGLANTGADSALLLWGAAGVVALGAGAASVAVARRKNA